MYHFRLHTPRVTYFGQQVLVFMFSAPFLTTFLSVGIEVSISKHFLSYLEAWCRVCCLACFCCNLLLSRHSKLMRPASTGLGICSCHLFFFTFTPTCSQILNYYYYYNYYIRRGKTYRDEPVMPKSFWYTLPLFHPSNHPAVVWPLISKRYPPLRYTTDTPCHRPQVTQAFIVL